MLILLVNMNIILFACPPACPFFRLKNIIPDKLKPQKSPKPIGDKALQLQNKTLIYTLFLRLQIKFLQKQEKSCIQRKKFCS